MTRAEQVDVAVVGGGPVGLFLAGLLVQRGISCAVLEKNTRLSTHSRAIGIHPPALERLEQLGVAEELITQGVEIHEGRAFIDTQPLGTLSFAHGPAPYHFVLSLPQCLTEAVLAAHLERICAGTLRLGAKVRRLRAEDHGVCVHYRTGSHEPSLHARFVVGCDGKRSVIRQAVGIPFEGGPYADRYLMGDVADSTELGARAGIYLCDDGLIESFPLPGGKRRWVVKLQQGETAVTVELLQQLIQRRLQHRIPVETSEMVSGFGVERYLAKRFVSGRVVLAGDAAHVLSPIGGQGMNLGWLDAWALAERLTHVCGDYRPYEDALQAYQQSRRKAARTAMKRAEFNMLLGRKTRFTAVRNIVAWSLLNTPLKRVMANVFTMRGLE